MEPTSHNDNPKPESKKEEWVTPEISLMSVTETEGGKIGALNEYSVNGAS